MAFTQTDVDALKRALATGALRVRFLDREVTYRSLEDMRATLRLIQSEVDAAAGVKPARVRQVRFMTKKGLC